jgi:prephenate dehydrogenase
MKGIAMFNRVAIIGLGLIGGSIGLALRNAKSAQQITGYDLGKGVTDRARRIGAIDQPYNALADAVRGAELIILATPVGAMHSLLQNIATVASPGSIVTDVASTKMQVISWAEEYLPASVSFVGGHPMAGREVSGVDSASATLFKNRIYCLTPTKHTSPVAIDKVSKFIEILGARVRFLEPAEHDGQVAGVSHLPFVASVVLMNTVAEEAAWSDAAILAASGFRDMTRLAAGSPEVYRDICLTNSESLTHYLDEYIKELSTFRDQIATHDSNLIQTFTKAQQLREQWQTSYDTDR